MLHEKTQRNQTNESLLKELNLTAKFGQDIIERINYSIKDANTDCLPSCKVQENPNQKSFVFYPQRNNFFYKIEFCNVASHILQMSCSHGKNEDKGQFRKELKFLGRFQTMFLFNIIKGHSEESCQFSAFKIEKLQMWRL